MAARWPVARAQCLGKVNVAAPWGWERQLDDRAVHPRAIRRMTGYRHYKMSVSIMWPEVLNFNLRMRGPQGRGPESKRD